SDRGREENMNRRRRPQFPPSLINTHAVPSPVAGVVDEGGVRIPNIDQDLDVMSFLSAAWHVVAKETAGQGMLSISDIIPQLVFIDQHHGGIFRHQFEELSADLGIKGGFNLDDPAHMHDVIFYLPWVLSRAAHKNPKAVREFSQLMGGFFFVNHVLAADILGANSPKALWWHVPQKLLPSDIVHAATVLTYERPVLVAQYERLKGVFLKSNTPE
ncbi:MAG: hypothetical protein EB121_07590, partial [Alphaproteobacteria bacterium]|nr:hypothetical protein [Alphaproteobacteria bacterium]